MFQDKQRRFLSLEITENSELELKTFLDIANCKYVRYLKTVPITGNLKETKARNSYNYWKAQKRIRTGTRSKKVR